MKRRLKKHTSINIKPLSNMIEGLYFKIVELNKNNQLFAEDVLSIDFRVSGKIFVEKK